MQAFLTLNVIHKALLSNPFDSLGPPAQHTGQSAHCGCHAVVMFHLLWLLSAMGAGATPTRSISQSEGQSSS